MTADFAQMTVPELRSAAGTLRAFAVVALDTETIPSRETLAHLRSLREALNQCKAEITRRGKGQP